MKSPNFYSSFNGGLLALMIIGAPYYSEAAEHSWIIPGQCAPPELLNRGIAPTTDPKLELHDKIVFDMKGGRLVMEFQAVDSKSLTIGWMWIAPEKITSGSSVFPKLNGSFVRTGAEEEALKSLKFTCSYDSREKRLLLRLGLDSPRYALVNQQGEQVGTGQPATRSESKYEGDQNPNPEEEGRSR